MDLFKKAAEMADGMFDLVSFISSRMESSRGLVNTADLIGRRGEVTVGIYSGQTGEIVVVIDGLRVSFGARADNGVAIKKGEIVQIESNVGAVVYVVPTELSRRQKVEKEIETATEEKVGVKNGNAETVVDKVESVIQAVAPVARQDASTVAKEPQEQSMEDSSVGEAAPVKSAGDSNSEEEEQVKVESQSMAVDQTTENPPKSKRAKGQKGS